MNIREKIQKIIDKARSTTSEAEAETLFAKAQEMMEKHQVEAYDLGNDSDPVGMTVGASGQSGPSAYRPLVQRALARYYGACTIRMWQDQKHYRIEIVGPESARITTELMTDYCWDQIKAEATRLANEGHGKRDAMIRKVANAFVFRLNVLNAKQTENSAPRTVSAQKNALVVKDATDAWVAKHYEGLTSVAGGKRTTTSAAVGAAAGISINRQMGGASTLRIGG